MKQATCSYEEHFLSLWAARPRKPIHGLLLEVNCAHFQSVCLKKKKIIINVLSELSERNVVNS